MVNKWFLFSNKTLLFLIYLKDFNNAVDKCIVYHFADDTNLRFDNKCRSEISCVMDNELQLLTDQSVLQGISPTLKF